MQWRSQGERRGRLLPRGCFGLLCLDFYNYDLLVSSDTDSDYIF